MSKLIKDLYGKRGEFAAEQDISAYVDYAKNSRAESKALFANQKTQYRSFAIIPDIVAVDIMTKFHLDVNAHDNGQEEMQKIRKIIIDNYPQLLTGNIVKNTKGR